MKGFTPWPGMVSKITYAAVDGDADVAAAVAAVFVFDCTFLCSNGAAALRRTALLLLLLWLLPSTS